MAMKIKVSSISDTGGADYSSVTGWAAGAQSDLDIFNVGEIEHTSETIAKILSEAEFVFGDFLLRTKSGKELARREGGELIFDPNIESALDSIGADSGAMFRDAVLDNKSRIVVPDLTKIGAELIAFLAEHPEYLTELSPRDFEKFLAEMFRRHGYETELGPGIGDGGVDLRLIRREDIGQMLFLVQAKKYAPNRKIPLVPVQALYGAVNSEGATKGLFVSTSDYEPVAKRFAEKHIYKIELIGPSELQNWLKKCNLH